MSSTTLLPLPLPSVLVSVNSLLPPHLLRRPTSHQKNHFVFCALLLYPTTMIVSTTLG